MHINSRASAWKKGLQHRADMMVTGVDWHEEIRCTIDSTTDGTHPLFVKSENAGEVAVRDDVDQRLAIFRRGCRMLRFVGLHFVFHVLRSEAYSALAIARLSWASAQHDSRTIAAMVFKIASNHLQDLT